MFFYLKSKYNIKKAFLSDINPDLVNAYKLIQNNPKRLIKKLKLIEENYRNMTDQAQHDYYYEMRNKFNGQPSLFDFNEKSVNMIDKVSNMIFLNRTCYNGLFRQNSKGEFNVPFGRYMNPTICDEDNILEVSSSLEGVKIECIDFSRTQRYIKKNTFVYLDPPYRPINDTSSFTSYDKNKFSDADQHKLAHYFKEASSKGAFLMLSNSDPKNDNPKDNFFEDLYQGFNFDKVLASRSINCDAKKRGQINELIITNY